MFGGMGWSSVSGCFGLFGLQEFNLPHYLKDWADLPFKPKVCRFLQYPKMLSRASGRNPHQKQ